MASPYNNTGVMDRRDAITRALMNIASPPPQSVAPRMPMGNPGMMVAARAPAPGMPPPGMPPSQLPMAPNGAVGVPPAMPPQMAPPIGGTMPGMQPQQALMQRR